MLDPFPDLPLSLAEEVGHFLDMLRWERRLARNSLDAYKADLACFTGWADACGLADFCWPTEQELLCYLKHLAQKGLAPSSIARRVVAIRSLYRWLLREGRIEKAACKTVFLLCAPKQWERIPSVMSREEASRLMNAPQRKDRYFHRDKALLELLYSSGCRASEAADLELDDLRLDAGTCRVRGKGAKDRAVPLGAYCVRSMQEYLLLLRPKLVKTDCPFVFLSQTGRKLGRIMAWNIVNRCARRVGLRVSTHSLRHTAATHLLSGGADLRHVAAILGHTDLQTTTIYTRVDMEDLHKIHAACHPTGAEADASRPAQREEGTLAARPIDQREGR